MQLLDLALADFRNFDRLELIPSPRATIAVGPNGQGKTNLLEAIYFLTTLKPLRAAKLAELIRFGSSAAEVSGRFRLKGANRQISVRIAEGSRQALVDGKKAQTLEDYFGGVSVVSFTPEDLSVVKGGPDERRRFLDRAVFNRFPSFLKDSRDYQRALRSRNKLLKELAPSSYLTVYDQAVAALGARIWKQRGAFLAEISSQVALAFKAIACIDAPLSCRYQPTHLSVDLKDAAEEELNCKCGPRAIWSGDSPRWARMPMISSFCSAIAPPGRTLLRGNSAPWSFRGRLQKSRTCIKRTGFSPSCCSMMSPASWTPSETHI